MPFTARTFPQLSQLVVRDPFKEDAQCIDVISVTNSGGVTLPMGAVLFRAKGVSSTAQWDAVTSDAVLAVGAEDGLPVNEFAVVFGDNYDWKASVTIPDTTATEVLAYVRGPCQLKSRLIEEYLLSAGNLDTDETANVIKLLGDQGILVNETIGTLG